MRQPQEDVDPEVNVYLTFRREGRIVARRESHNVFLNAGRAWITQRCGSSDFALGTPHTLEVIRYVGFGCGGALQSDPQFANSQAEIVTVEALEDPISFSEALGVKTYLKSCDDQLPGDTTYFPGNGRIVFVCGVAETEISYAAATTAASNVNVGTSVPVSEIGLYLSSALPTDAGAAPTGPNNMVAYNIFDPVFVTPDVSIQARWELRF